MLLLLLVGKCTHCTFCTNCLIAGKSQKRVRRILVNLVTFLKRLMVSTSNLSERSKSLDDSSEIGVSNSLAE